MKAGTHPILMPGKCNKPAKSMSTLKMPDGCGRTRPTLKPAHQVSTYRMPGTWPRRRTNPASPAHQLLMCQIMWRRRRLRQTGSSMHPQCDWQIETAERRKEFEDDVRWNRSCVTPNEVIDQIEEEIDNSDWSAGEFICEHWQDDTDPSDWPNLTLKRPLRTKWHWQCKNSCLQAVKRQSDDWLAKVLTKRVWQVLRR